MVYYVLLISWVLYTLIEGYREGYYWHYKMNTTDHSDNSTTDLHGIFTMQRGVVSILIFFALTLVLNIYGSFIIMVANTLIFSFLHNGMMYLTRNKLSVKMHPNNDSKWKYKKKWFSMSNTSTAKLTNFMTPFNRTVLFVLGIGCYVYVYLTFISIW